MHPLPHRYRVSARAAGAEPVTLESAGLASIASDGPKEFDGPGDLWSPETLLCGAVADCYLLSFRAVAGAARLSWTRIAVEVEGTLDRIDRSMQFTAFVLNVHLVVPPGADPERAHKLLEKAEQICLVSASLKAVVTLQIEVHIE